MIIFPRTVSLKTNKLNYSYGVDLLDLWNSHCRSIEWIFTEVISVSYGAGFYRTELLRGQGRIPDYNGILSLSSIQQKSHNLTVVRSLSLAFRFYHLILFGGPIP
jgi:hypothetical protein